MCVLFDFYLLIINFCIYLNFIYFFLSYIVIIPVCIFANLLLILSVEFFISHKNSNNNKNFPTFTHANHPSLTS